jgi:NAD(P)H-flavin reductase
MRFFKHQFYIDKVVQETPDVYSVYIKGKNIEQFTYEAGQFANYTFLQKGMYFTHPFSFSTAPNAEYIRISVRGVGDFTRRIPELRPGTKVVIDGPLGIFTERSSARDKYLFIAGGIGITPLRSLAEDLSKRGKDITLLYGNRTADNIPLKAELEAMPIKISHILSMIPAARTLLSKDILIKKKFYVWHQILLSEKYTCVGRRL